MNILSYLKSFLKNGGSDNSSGSSLGSESARKLKELEDFLSEQRKNSTTTVQKDDSPELPKYDRYEYEAPSDEELRKSAEAELSDYLHSGENAIKEEYAAKERSLNADKANGERSFSDSSDKLRAAYEQAAQTLSDDSLKRGLARSSIAMNNQAAANKVYMQNVGELIRERDQRIADIDSELSSLNGQLKSALDSFRISYAAKLTQRINELSEEREKNVREAVKYNNSIKQREYEEQLEKQDRDKKSQPSSDRIDDGTDDISEREFYVKAADVLGSLPLEEARKLFNGSPIFRENLGDYYYYTLYYKYR